MYQLQVRVVSGNNLPVGDLNGFSDPYVKLFWGGQTVKTSTKKKTLNPYWNETFTLTSSLATEPLKVSCYDWDRFTRDDVLGTGEVRTDDLINKTEKSVTVHLSPRGEIQLRLTALNFPEHYGNTAGTTTYTTTSYVPMGGGGTVDDMLKQRFSMGYNSGAAPYMSGPAPYGSVGLGAPQGPPSYYPPPQSQAPPASYYPTPQQPTYPTSYMPTGGGAPSSYLPGGYGGPPAGGYGTGAPPPAGGYGGGYGGPPGGGYGTGGAPYGGAPPPGGGYPPQQYPPTGY